AVPDLPWKFLQRTRINERLSGIWPKVATPARRDYYSTEDTK
ncbi:hypothetical protein I7I51_07524, partial [Histoplasma capsulatum]